MSKAKEERRFKILLVSDDLMLTVLRLMLRDYTKCLTIPDLRDIPEDAEILRVEYRYEYMAFGFLLAHESFDPVPEGCAVECIAGKGEDKTIEIKQPVSVSTGLSRATQNILSKGQTRYWCCPACGKQFHQSQTERSSTEHECPGTEGISVVPAPWDGDKSVCGHTIPISSCGGCKPTDNDVAESTERVKSKE